jgi:light-harvesting complex I chlorophyll a/b binding protein 1|eukprot:scaffold21703_cov67-Cyclotella_meneghiniana.AAC.1
MMKIAAASLLAGSAAAFAPAQQGAVKTSLDAMPERMWNKMVDKTQRSKAMPFLPRPINLDGSYVGDVGFDPFYLSSIEKNFAGFIQPPSWEETPGIPTLYWMREAELKHGRIAMLAVAGWVATDIGMRFPGAGAPYTSVPNAFSAHDIMVENGSMWVMLSLAGLIEICSGAVLVEVSKGESDREAGDYSFDPLKLLSPSNSEMMKLKELTNGRAAMMAFSGLATQTALGGVDFPYLVPYPVTEVTW